MGTGMDMDMGSAMTENLATIPPVILAAASRN
jgi:hypothetical protein